MRRYAGDEVVLRVPQDIDTLEGQDTCPSCNEDYDGLICENCGFENPPQDLANPDTTPDDRQDTENEERELDHDQAELADLTGKGDAEQEQTFTNGLDYPSPEEMSTQGMETQVEPQMQSLMSEDDEMPENQGMPLDDDPAGQEYYKEQVEQGDYENPDEERRREMSRYQDLLATSSIRRGAPGGAPPGAKYDQRSTMYLDSMGLNEQAPEPGEAMTEGELWANPRKEIDVTNLDENNVSGGPGNSAVHARRRNRRMDKATLQRRSMARRAALRRLAEEAQELQGEAEQDIGEITQEVGDVQESPTDGGLGSIDEKLDELEQVVDELGAIAEQGGDIQGQEADEMGGGEMGGMPPGAPPAAPGGEMGGMPPPEPQAQPMTQPPMPQAGPLPNVNGVKSMKRHIRRARRIIRQARRRLAELDQMGGMPEDDQQVTGLLGELDNEVGALDQDIDQLDSQQEQDNIGDSMGRPEDSGMGGPPGGDMGGGCPECGGAGCPACQGGGAPPMMARRRRAKKPNHYKNARARTRTARRHLRSALTMLSDFGGGDDFMDDQAVDQEIEHTVQDTGDIVQTLEQIEQEQMQDMNSGEPPRPGEDLSPHADEAAPFMARRRLTRKQKRARLERTRRIKALKKKAEVTHKKAQLLQARFIRAEDDDLIADLGSSIESDLQGLESEVGELESFEENFSGDDLNGSGSTGGDFDGTDLNGGGGSVGSADFEEPQYRDESTIEARRRAANMRRRLRAPRQGTNGIQETNRRTDVTDLDSGPMTRDQAETADYRTDVLQPVNEGNQLDKADITDDGNYGAGTGYTWDNPPSRAQWPYDSPEGYWYKGSSRRPLPPGPRATQGSNTRVYAALQIVDKMEKLGMTRAEDRMKHVAEYERMSPEKLSGVSEMLDKMKSSNALPSRSTRVASRSRNENPMSLSFPQMGELKTAGKVTLEDVQSDDYLAAL